ncbi:hypothetical protein GCM10011444_03180 [Winogradskyella haliclonae]|uniref:Uncharacterized protein n=1 Tax=Winogradskyella haliclonae TaxID=2048558 RepID=A0ABQ2BU92_9FLAO|nr:hypothetical protein GCM10011444_03180 [Winogradskyella haliclonae]
MVSLILRARRIRQQFINIKNVITFLIKANVLFLNLYILPVLKNATHELGTTPVLKAFWRRK